MLFVESSETATSLAEKLRALNSLYEEACGLLRISVADFPLAIRRAEIGSLWLDVIGTILPIRTLTRWLERAADYLYRQHTDEGRLFEGIPKRVEMVSQIIQLRQQLANMNRDTSELDDQIDKAAIIIGGDLNTLLLGSRRVRINETTIELQPASQKRLSAPEETKLLNAPDAENKDPDTKR